MKKKFLKISKYRPSLLQGSFDFSSIRAGASLYSEHPFERLLISLLVLSLLVLTGAYLYFVSASVLNVVARREAVTKADDLLSAMANAEQEYFALKEEVDTEEMRALGLQRVEREGYVYVPGATALSSALSRNGL